MNSEIKKRVACLKSKGIPLDYQKTKAGIMPADWDGTIKARQVFKSHTDKKHDRDLEILAATQENGIVPRSQIDIDIKCSEEGISGYKRVDAGDFVISLRSFQGGIEYSLYDGIVSPAYTVLKPIKDIADEYYKNYFKTDDFIQRLNGAVYGIRDGKQISYEDFGDLYIHFPPFAEQQKIGEILSQCDKVIELYRCELQEIKKLKKACLQKLFPQHGSKSPEVRFPGFNTPWEQRKFSEITFPSGVRNRDNLPLESYSITNENGFVPQDEKFENGGTMREADKRMYYIVSPYSFAYNPARINVGSIGYQNLSKNVIVSSLYEVFQTTDEIDDRFLWHWFKSSDFQKLIEQLQEGGVRLYFYYDKLCMGTLSFPSLEEQRKIGQYLDALDHLITLHLRKLEEMERMKKALMQFLLTGIVRVNSK